MNQAQHLYREGKGNYALAMYTAGLAVECLLRAYLLRKGKKEFESRHDVLLLWKESGILALDPERLKAKGLSERQVQEHQKAQWAAVNQVYILWRNNYRFASEDRLLAHLKTMKSFSKVKGDLLKAKAYELLNAAQRFVDKGVLQWH
jgi:hypothetical protein